MSAITSTFRRDANRQPISNLGFTESKLITFDGGTTNGIGDYDGTGNPVTLFSVTGDVAINVFGICTVDLVGASATVEFGVTSSTAALGNQQTATNVDQYDVYHDAVLAIGGQVAGHAHITSEDVILTVGTANITAGAIQFYCLWNPLSSDGKVTAA